MKHVLCIYFNYRGMTWTGSIYNMFSNNPLPPSTSDRDSKAAASSSTHISSNSSSINQPSSGSNLLTSSGPLKQDDDLSDIAIAVQELHGIGTALGQALEEQNSKLNRIDSKVSHVHDKTVSVTLKSSQMVGYKSKSKIEYLGQYQFEYMSGEGLYLSVDDSGNIILTRTKDRSTYFDVYVKQESIFALQNSKTLTFLSVTWTGALRATGQKFTPSEEVYMDLRVGEVTGLFFLACNWGGGGWLRTPRRSDQTKCLYEVSSGISDKTNAALFMAIKYDLVDTSGSSR